MPVMSLHGGPAGSTVHPYLQDGALDRSGSSEIHQLEAEAGDVISNRRKERVD